MNFFSLDFCRELQAAGCVSLSGHQYAKHSRSDRFLVYHYSQITFKRIKVPAFNSYDFIAPNPVAVENCKKRFGDKLHCYDCLEAVAPPMTVGGFVQIGTGQCSCSRQFENNITAWEMHRHAMIDLNSETEAEEYLKRNRAK